MGGTPTIDFSKYTAAPSIDFSKYANAAADDPHTAIKQKYGLPDEADLRSGYLSDKNINLKMDAGKFSQAYREANPEQETPTSFLGRSWDEVKNLFKGALEQPQSVAGFAPPNPQGTLEAAKARGREAVEHPAAAAGAGLVDLTALAAPFFPELGGRVWSKISPAASFEEALGTKLSAVEADAPRPGGQIQPALNNTPREVLQHAHDEGIKLTPGQATENALAQNAQKSGVNAAVGGRELQNALIEQKTKFGQAVNSFMDDVDPKRAGLSAESAGEQIKQTQQVAKSISHDNASQGYAKIDYLMDKPIDGALISAAWNKVKGNLPMSAEEAILSQTPRSMRAVVSDLLSSKPEGFQPTVSQTIQLRKFFREMGETEGLPNQTQGIFRVMSQAADATAEAGTAKLGGAADWRAANAGWKDYASKYGNPQSILYKIGRTQDPARVTTMLTNASAADINILKAEKMDAALEPLRRQVVQDIAQSRFNVGHDGLGGYSDSYLKALFLPEEVKELYLKGDLANRLKYDPNPSGTAAGIQSLEQLKLGNQAKMTTAAKLSMPRDPLSFLSPKSAEIRTAPFAAKPKAAAVVPQGNLTPFSGDLFNNAEGEEPGIERLRR